MNDPSVQKIIDKYQSISKKMMDRVAASQVKVVPPKLVAKYESGSAPGLMYSVHLDRSDKLTCTCPGFVYRRRCRHITSCEQEIFA
tara:strand:+ start:139 stop:396 length:258 start_codon:yes stop_codon:yes gene_type:complete